MLIDMWLPALGAVEMASTSQTVRTMYGHAFPYRKRLMPDLGGAAGDHWCPVNWADREDGTVPGEPGMLTSASPEII